MPVLGGAPPAPDQDPDPDPNPTPAPTLPTPTPTQPGGGGGNNNLFNDADSLMNNSNNLATDTDGSAAFLARYRHGGKVEPKDRAIKNAGGGALTDKYGNLI